MNLSKCACCGTTINTNYQHSAMHNGNFYCLNCASKITTTPPTSMEVEELTDSYGQLHEDNCELVASEDGSYDGCTCDMKHLTQAIQRLIQQAELRVWEQVAIETRTVVCDCGEEWSETDLGINTEKRIAELQAQLTKEDK